MPLDRRWLVLVSLAPLLVGAAAPRATQPEDKLLDPGRLRGELLRRGMKDLLRAYLDECPPTGDVEGLIYRRQQQLAIYEDKSRDEDECLEALDRAIALLEQAIEKYPKDRRAMDWRLELGRDLVYKRAEPYYNNILYRGGSKEDREQLLAITTRATKAFDGLINAIERWNQQLQQLGEDELKKLENSGEIARFRRLEPQARYFASWARFYRALATPPGETRTKMLEEIITYFTVSRKEWIETDHEQSGVQCQALLLLGMTYRLADDPAHAEEFLGKAVKRATALKGPVEKRSMQWVVFLGKMEQVKLLRDQGKFAEALERIQAMTEDLAKTPEVLSKELAAALLEGSIYVRQAETAKAKKDDKAYAELMARSRRPLIDLAGRRPKAKARIYSSLYPLLGKDPDLARLGPFDMSVYIAGLLGDGVRAQRRADQLRSEAGDKPDEDVQKRLAQLEVERKDSLTKAVAAAKAFPGKTDAAGAELAERLRPEILFNLAVCYFHLNRPLEAVPVFVQLARKYPEFANSRDAALNAVRIAAELNRDPANAARPEVRTAFINALRVLTGQYGDSDDARYWQFFLANTLELQGRDREAADAYAKVVQQHENYLDARYHRIACLARDFDAAASSQSSNQAALIGQAKEIAAEALACAKRLQASLDGIEDAPRKEELQRAAGDALLTAARLTLEPPVKQYRLALEMLGKVKVPYEKYPDLMGRRLRLEILAYQGMGQLQEASKLIHDYREKDPEHAGATLSALLDSMQDEAKRARQRAQLDVAKQVGAEAVKVAKELYGWARDTRKGKPDEVFEIRVRYARACLEAEQYEQARTLYRQCFDEDVARSPKKEPMHGPTMLGLAESHYRLGLAAAKAGHHDQAGKSLATASKRFLAIFRRSPPYTPIWWQARLRVTQIPIERRELTVDELDKGGGRTLTEKDRTLLADVPKLHRQVEQVVAAERMKDPKLGGHAAEFNALLRQSERLARRAKRFLP